MRSAIRPILPLQRMVEGVTMELQMIADLSAAIGLAALGMVGMITVIIPMIVGTFRELR